MSRKPAAKKAAAPRPEPTAGNWKAVRAKIDDGKWRDFAPGALFEVRRGKDVIALVRAVDEVASEEAANAALIAAAKPMLAALKEAAQFMTVLARRRQPKFKEGDAAADTPLGRALAAIKLAEGR